MTSKLVNNLIFIGLFLTFLFWWPWASVPFEVPKVIFFEYFVKILALVFGYKILKNQIEPRHTSKLFLLIILFLAWSILTAFLGVNIGKSFVGNFYRNDGLVTLFHLIGFALLVGYFWNEKLKYKLSLAFFLSSLVLSIIALLEILTGSFGIGSAATFGNPNFLAGFLVVSLPFGYYLFVSQKKLLYLLGSSISVLAILLIGAVSGILTLAIWIIILISLSFKGKLKYLLILSSVSAAFVISIFWIKDYYAKNSKSFIAEGRVRIYRNIIVGATKRPLFGYGWANVDSAFESNVWPIKFNNDVYVDKAHSELLETLATTGLPGLVIYLLMIGLVFVKLQKSLKTTEDKNWEITLISVLILFIFHSQTNVISITEQIVFWTVLGMILI